MVRWRPRIGRLMLVLVVFGSGFLGARLGLLHAPVAQASHNFGDVPDSAFYHAFVQFLLDFGITAGCGPGQFCGEAPVTRGQMAVFLKKLFDVVDKPSFGRHGSAFQNLVGSSPTTVVVVGGAQPGGTGASSGPLVVPANSPYLGLHVQAHVAFGGAVPGGTTCSLEQSFNGGPFTPQATTGVPTTAPTEAYLSYSYPIFSFPSTTVWTFRVTCQTTSSTAMTSAADIGVVALPVEG